jgi:hypothetical protein
MAKKIKAAMTTKPVFHGGVSSDVVTCVRFEKKKAVVLYRTISD